MSKKPKLTVIDEDVRRRIELQNAEFKALEHLIKVYCIHQKTPAVEDGYFAVKGFQNIWQKLPASTHGNGGTLSFADGHAEFWKWIEPETAKRKTWDEPGKKPVDRDLIHFQKATATDD